VDDLSVMLNALKIRPKPSPPIRLRQVSSSPWIRLSAAKNRPPTARHGISGPKSGHSGNEKVWTFFHFPRTFFHFPTSGNHFPRTFFHFLTSGNRFPRTFFHFPTSGNHFLRTFFHFFPPRNRFPRG
jgi:hypothetical protein